MIAERWRNLSSEEKQLYTTKSTNMRQVCQKCKITKINLMYFFVIQSFALKHPNYKTPKKEEDQYQFSFKLKDSVEKTISKNKNKQKKNSGVVAKKRHHSVPEVLYSPITQKDDNLKFLDQESLLCELLAMCQKIVLLL